MPSAHLPGEVLGPIPLVGGSREDPGHAGEIVSNKYSGAAPELSRLQAPSLCQQVLSPTEDGYGWVMDIPDHHYNIHRLY